jgi:hypothetical protein
MNLDVLNHIIKNEPERIEGLAAETGQDAQAGLGIAAQVLSKKGDVSTLSQKQKFVFDKCVRPLIEAVPCEGVIGYNDDGEDTCSHGGVIDDESLLRCYQEDEFMCQNCRYDAEKMSDA